ncbi:MAG: hypothetical protein ITG02_07570 [Patulibacter sp.]|nr:hypothetical protein [Patulibacter sp.]
MRVPRRTSVLLLLGGLWLSGVSSATAQSGPSEAPPGNSAVDQYRESLPPSSGERRSLDRDDREALRRQGQDGRALASVLERNGGVPRAAAEATADSTPDRDRAPGSDGRRGGSSGASGRDRAEGSAADASEQPAEDRRSGSVAPAAAASTVGPVPVWAMLAAAGLLVGVGLVVRTRLTP